MARIRTLKPEILDDDKTGTLSNAEWRLFVSLILLADDHGRLRANPIQIRAAVFWGTKLEDETEELLRRLEEVRLIDRYVVGGQPYALLRGWKKHQKVDHPSGARIPAPEDADRGSRDADRGSREEIAKDSRETREDLAKVDPTDGDQKENSQPREDLAKPSRLIPIPIPIPIPTPTSEGSLASRIWPAHEWNRKFGLAWRDKYGSFYGNPGDTEVTGKLGALLADCPEAAKLEAQRESPRMFAEFLGREDARHVERRHPWSFFVQDWGGLRVEKRQAQRAESFAERDARLVRERVEAEKIRSDTERRAVDRKLDRDRQVTPLNPEQQAEVKNLVRSLADQKATG